MYCTHNVLGLYHQYVLIFPSGTAIGLIGVFTVHRSAISKELLRVCARIGYNERSTA